MKKYQKRIVAIFSMLMVLLAMVPQNVSAKEVDKRIAVNVQVPEDWTEPCVWAWDEDGNNAFEAWPDAVICANNYIAYGCVSALKDHNVSIPDTMAVITFDDFPFSKILKPRLTVVDIDMYDMGVQAGKYVLQKIKKNNLYIQSYATLPSITEREST